jgi:hypothetical protein
LTKEALKLAQEPSATRPCRSCGETGERWTGINEAPTSICKPCNGTGQIALAKPAQDVDYWIREATAARQAEMAMRRELEAQPAQELVAWMQADHEHISLWEDVYHTIPLYTNPQQRTWVGLTDAEIKKICDCTHGYDADERIARAVEQLLKEKNNGA